MTMLIDRFVAEHLPRLRPGTRRHYRSLIDAHIRPFFGAHAKVAEIGFADIDRLHRQIAKPYAANRSVAVLHKMFALAIGGECVGEQSGARRGAKSRNCAQTIPERRRAGSINASVRGPDGRFRILSAWHC